MDVKKSVSLALLFFALVFTACAQTKTVGSVFPNSSAQSVTCSGEQLITKRFLVTYEDGRFEIISNPDKDDFVENFLKPNLAAIRHVEYDAKLKISQYQTQAYNTATGQPDNWGQTKVSAPAVWNLGYNGDGVKVAVVDAAVDYSQPQINPQLSINTAEYNGKAGIDDDGNGYVDDVYGWDFANNKPQPTITAGNDHGTHVSGIILANHNAGPVLGMAQNAKLIPVNFMDQDGGGSIGNAILGIKYAAARGANVINASWGGGACSETLRETIQSLADQNIMFIAASGNDYVDYDISGPSYYSYPAVFNLPNQMTVAATDVNDYVSDFSNKSYTLVQLGAPGVQVWSTVPNATQEYMSGTSMATPFVTGAVALLMGARPNATYTQIKQAILSTVDVIAGRPYKVSSQGRLNVQKALTSLLQNVPAASPASTSSEGPAAK
jgi:subtilisin family serine protease